MKTSLAKLREYLVYITTGMLITSWLAELFSQLRLFGLTTSYTVPYWHLILILALLGISINPFLFNSSKTKPCKYPERDKCILDSSEKNNETNDC